MRTEHIIDDTLKAAAEAALADVHDRVKRVEGTTIYDPQLNELLRPLRRLTLGAVCFCGRNVCWLAIDNAGAFVAAFQRRRPARMRHGGVADCKLPYLANSYPKAPWIMLAETGSTTVTLEDIKTSGYPIRLRLSCPRCGAQHLSLNTTRLTDFLTTISTGESTIWLTN